MFNNKRFYYSSRIAAIVLVLAFIVGVGSVVTVRAQTGWLATETCIADDIHPQPDIFSGVVKTLYIHDTATLLGWRTADNIWVKVTAADGATGWAKVVCLSFTVSLDSFAIYAYTPTPAVTPTPTPVYGGTGAFAIVNTGALNVRSGPGYWYSEVARVYLGDTVWLAGYRNADASWVMVRLLNGIQGWVNAHYLITSYPLSSLAVVGGVQPATLSYSGYRTHVVQPGENLFRISLNYGVNMYTVAQLNGIVNLARIYAGQVLLIP